jgi:hypothetical protein
VLTPITGRRLLLSAELKFPGDVTTLQQTRLEMKRRDLLKTAGTMMLAAPAVRGSALVETNSKAAAQGPNKNLVVAFSGAFCFWQENDRFKVMVPPVGHDSKDPHRPWAGTTANSKALQGSPNFTLSIGGFTPPSGGALPLFTGTPCFSYEQGTGSGSPPLLNLYLPVPTQIIGVRPTGAKMVCSPGTSDPYCTQYMTYASGLSFVYQNVDLDRVAIAADSDKGPADFYKPCFTNDQSLGEATLTIHLTPLTRALDPGHRHARYVWKQMISMYPWMEQEIHDIDFCPDFDPSACPASCLPEGSRANQKQDEPMKLMVGPSDDCEVPIMVLPPRGAGKPQKPRR